MKRIIKTGLILLSTLILIGCTKEDQPKEQQIIGKFEATSNHDNFQVWISIDGVMTSEIVHGKKFVLEAIVKDGMRYELTGEAFKTYQDMQVRIYKNGVIMNEKYDKVGQKYVTIKGNF